MRLDHVARLIVNANHSVPVKTAEGLLTGKTCAQSEPDIVKYWEIIADNLSKAGWELGLRLSD